MFNIQYELYVLLGVYILIHFDETCTVCYRTEPFELIFFSTYYYCCLWFTFWISFYYHYTFSFFLFQEILFARLIASLSGWFLFFWSQTFLFLCNLVNMIFCFSMFYYPYCCLIFIILLTLWKISWMFENMYFVKLFTSKHEKLKTF